MSCPAPHLLALLTGQIDPDFADEPSAIAKRALAGPVAITALGLAGDHQADRIHHGGPDKALHAYPFERGERAMHHAQRVAKALALPKAQSAILPMVFGTAEATLEAAEKLKDKGILAIAIRPPTVSPGTARLRLAFTARHSDEDVHKLIASLRELR